MCFLASCFGSGFHHFPTKPPIHLCWYGLGVVLSSWCGIIRSQKIIRGKDRVNEQMWHRNIRGSCEKYRIFFL